MKSLLTIILVMFSLISFSQDTIKTQEIKDVVVIGVRSDYKTPITQKILNKDYILKSYQGQEISFILGKTPSITTQSDGGQENGYTTFRLRGIDQTRINMSLDGVPLNEPEDEGVYFSNYPDFATYINSIQIQRGVGTSINGTASYAGNLNFESKNGITKDVFSEIGYSSFNTSRINFGISSGISKNKLALFFGGSEYTTDGYKYNAYGNGYSGFLNLGYYNNKDIFKLTTFTGNSNNGMAWYAVLDSDVYKDPRTNYNPKGENDNFKQTLVQFKYIHTIRNNSIITNTVYYNYLKGIWGMFINDTDLFNFNLESNFYGYMSNYHLELNNLVINVGINTNSYQREHYGVLLDTLRYINNGYKRDYSGFTKVSFTHKNLILFGDIQYRGVFFKYIGDVSMNPIYWSFINPKCGLTLVENKNIKYYFTIGKSHREPTRTDMFGGMDNLVTLNIITPEEVTDYELGSNINSKDFILNYNFFFMNFKNEITLLGILGSNGLPLMTNIDKSFRSGFELDMSGRINDFISTDMNLTLMNSRIISDTNKYVPLLTPSFIINKDLTYKNKNITIGLSSKYQSKSYINLENTQTIPSFIIFGLNASYQFKHFNISGTLNNLTNIKYFTSGYVISGDKYLYVNAPRNFTFTLKYN